MSTAHIVTLLMIWSKGLEMGKSIHVTPHTEGGWQVKTAGNERATKVCNTQKECINYAKQQAQNNGSELCIHNREGRIREKNSYGKDPYPPRG